MLSRHVLRRAMLRSFFSHYCCYRDRAVRVSEDKSMQSSARQDSAPRAVCLQRILCFALILEGVRLMCVSCVRFLG